MKTLCVTGHRPAKLPWKYKKEGSNTMSIASPSVVILMIVFATATHILFRVWRSDVDMDFAETVLDFKAQYGFPILLERYPLSKSNFKVGFNRNRSI